MGQGDNDNSKGPCFHFTTYSTIKHLQSTEDWQG